VELEDYDCLNDYNISEGCTLKLILAMRGGPINIRRVPVKYPIREITGCMDPSREDIWEKAPSSKQVTFLVYREGDQLNFFRVVDRGDGTLTPLSESFRYIDLYGSDDEDTEASSSGQQIIENFITMNKMKLLKAKMENMNLSKKPRKVVGVKPRPPAGPRPTSGSTAAPRPKFLRALPHIGQRCLPPGTACPAEMPQKALPPLAAAGGKTLFLAREALKGNGAWASAMLPARVGSIELPTSESRTEQEGAALPTDSSALPVPALPQRVGKHAECGALTKESDPSLYLDSANVSLPATEETFLPNTDALALLAEANFSEPCAESCGAGKVNTELQLSEGNEDCATAEQPSKSTLKFLTSARIGASILNSRELSPQKNSRLSPLHCSGQRASCSPHRPQTQAKCFEVGNWRPAASPNILQASEVHSLADSPYSRASRLHGIGIDSPGKRPDIHSKAEAKESTEVAIKASKDPAVSLNSVGLLSSLTRSTNRDGLQNPYGAGRFQASGVALSTNLQHFQEDFRVSSAHKDRPGYFLSSGLGLTGNAVMAGKRMGEQYIQTHLPPVNGSVHTKKKIVKHCFFCGKKTGLATSYECRCGNNFCATHRYAETHICTYDYKSVGRRCLQESNPVVSAPKLPKI
uniref:Zinc finger AN1-type containing 4 n=1 Tax=Varanus komodoensis TaxID=61221 RepID=A0A8D2KTS7_VARKO